MCGSVVSSHAGSATLRRVPRSSMGGKRPVFTSSSRTVSHFSDSKLSSLRPPTKLFCGRFVDEPELFTPGVNALDEPTFLTGEVLLTPILLLGSNLFFSRIWAYGQPHQTDSMYSGAPILKGTNAGTELSPFVDVYPEP